MGDKQPSETSTERHARLRAADLIPRRRHDGISELRLMAEAEGYVMIRRKGATPFLKTTKWWLSLSETPE